jgi:putative intracellular protease/amidase
MIIRRGKKKHRPEAAIKNFYSDVFVFKDTMEQEVFRYLFKHKGKCKMKSKFTSGRIVLAIFVLMLLTFCSTRTESTAKNGVSCVNVLLIFANNYGLNSFLNRDTFEEYGWDMTYTGVTDSVSACPPVEKYYGVPPVIPDIKVSEITDVTKYDAIALMSGAGDYNPVPNPYGDIIASPEALKLVSNAVNNAVPLWTLCSGVRVFAAADVIRGKTIIAPPKFKEEMLSAGAAEVLPKDHYPVTDGSIITCARDLYYNFVNVQALINAVENRRDKKGTKKHSNKKFIFSSPAGYTENNIDWEYTYGGSGNEGARAVFEASDGSLMLTGYSFSEGSGDADILIIKTDADGNEIWSKTYGGAGTEYGNKLIEVSDGYLVTGYTTSFGAGSKDVYLLKIDKNGKVLWSKTFGGSSWDIGTGLCKTDNGYIICGYTYSFGAGEEDFYMIKTDKSGNKIWEKTYGGNRYELAHSVFRTTDGGFLIGGNTGTFGKGNSDVYLVKTDGEGKEIWAKSFGLEGKAGYGFDTSKKMILTGDGGCIIAGYTDNNDIMDAYVLKIDAQGNEEWHTSFGNKPFYDFGCSIVAAPDGGYIMAGVTKSIVKNRIAYDNNIYAVKLGKDGYKDWEKTIGGSETDWANDLIITSDGNVVITGHTCSFGKGKLDVFLLKIKSVS